MTMAVLLAGAFCLTVPFFTTSLKDGYFFDAFFLMSSFCRILVVEKKRGLTVFVILGVTLDFR